MHDDKILQEGEQGDNLYFLNKGEVTVMIRKKIVKPKPVENEDEEEAEPIIEKQNKIIAFLKEGAIFGEIALFTKLKRTASITSDDFTNCAYLTRDDVKQIEHNFPHIAKQFRDRIVNYADEKMEFRKRMIRNLHYLHDMNNEIINMILCNLEVQRYAKGQIILKNGDISDRIMFLREGEIDVKVTNQVSQDVEVTEENELLFDFLNTVSSLIYNIFTLYFILIEYC